jgi:predicted NUDIX family NTP pyrophosphohydrolase
VPKIAAGLLMYRRRESGLEVLLVHPGGPYFVRRDEGVWSIPKGEVSGGEATFAAALREFAEETGIDPSAAALDAPPRYLALGGVKYRQHKIVYAWAFEGDCDAALIVSNTFTMEWPRGSGRLQEVPEVDRGAWFDLPNARVAILPPLLRFLHDLEALVASSPD